MQTCGLLGNHLTRPPVHAGWSLWWVSSKWQQGSERKRSQEVGKGGEAGGAPPSLAARDTHTHSRGEQLLKGPFVFVLLLFICPKCFCLFDFDIFCPSKRFSDYLVCANTAPHCLPYVSSVMNENTKPSYMYCMFAGICKNVVQSGQQVIVSCWKAHNGSQLVSAILAMNLFFTTDIFEQEKHNRSG